MKNIIKELYFGNIEPQTRSFENDSFLQKQMSILSSCEQALTDMEFDSELCYHINKTISFR